MKLYNSPGSCSSASHIALLESGEKFEVIKLDLKSDRKLPDGRTLTDINPKGYVPVLELDDGSFLTENVAVLLYIADQNPESALAPLSDTTARYHLLEWLAFINSEIHKSMGMFFNPKLPEEMRPLLTANLDRRYAYIDERLSGGKFLMGDTFTVADAYLFIVSRWAPGVKYDMSEFANLQAWQKRVGDRESVKKALKPA